MVRLILHKAGSAPRSSVEASPLFAATSMWRRGNMTAAESCWQHVAPVGLAATTILHSAVTDRCFTAVPKSRAGLCRPLRNNVFKPICWLCGVQQGD